MDLDNEQLDQQEDITIDDREPLDHLLVISALRYRLTIADETLVPESAKGDIAQQLVTILRNNDMAPYYNQVILAESSSSSSSSSSSTTPSTKQQNSSNSSSSNSNVSSILGQYLQQADIDTWTRRNEEELAALDAKIKDAEDNLGENEVREALLAKSRYFHKIGDKQGALEQYRKTESKTIALGQKLDIVFSVLRLGFAWMDMDLLQRSLEKAKSMIEQGGDWERRNKLRVYEGLYLLCVRNFAQAAQLFLDSISTFTSYEILDYEQFVLYTIVAAMVSFERPQIKKRVIDSPDVLSVLNKMPHADRYLNSLYECRYAEFLVALADISDEMGRDRVLAPHIGFYCREMKIRAYTQFLEAYKSVTLRSLSDSFGLSLQYVDRDLSRFIAAGRLNCKIDNVGGVVETSQVDDKNVLYNQVLKHGDALCNRLQKLSRVIDL